MRITRREKKFWEQHLSCVRHITLDPKGPGVVRLHMIPPLYQFLPGSVKSALQKVRRLWPF